MNTLLKILLLLPAFILHQQAFSQYKIGTLDIYGNRQIPASTIMYNLPVKVGDTVSRESFNVDSVAAMLMQLPGVKHATVNPVCCDTAGNLMIYVGIGENDDCILQYNKAPVMNISLPTAMADAYKNCSDLLDSAVIHFQSEEDDSRGYALSAYKPAYNVQLKFVDYANRQFDVLNNVLKNAASDEQRAAAAQIIAYADNKKKIVDALLPAVNDTAEEVRNNATRALGILAGYANAHPQAGIVIPAGPFIKMINSIVWTDRNKGASVLMHLSKTTDATLLATIKRQAYYSILEMATWHDRPHAFFAFFILGHLAGMTDGELIQKNFSPNWRVEVEAMKKLIIK